MIEASKEVALFQIALRDILATQEQQLGLVTTESENECVDILCRTSNTSMFLDLYKDFKVAGEALKEYTAKLPQRTDELLNAFIGTWVQSHPPETFYASEFRKFLIK